MRDIVRFLYINILRPILFKFDPERVHNFFLEIGEFLGKYSITREITDSFFNYSNKILEQKVLGIDFKNPIGLAAGFDRNAELTQILPSIGFGFEEIGSVTSEFCLGNSRPCLWYLPESRGLIVGYELKNNGCESISKNLEKMNFEIPLGINIAKINNSKTSEIEDGIRDFVKAYRIMSGIGNYHVLNISCPNAYGGELFTIPTNFRQLMNEIEKIRVAAPLLVKLSPDLPFEQVDQILEIAQRTGINGIICSNLTKDHINPKIIDVNVPENGGISGKPLEEEANELIKYVYKKTAGQMVIIGCGGVFSAEDAYKKIKMGASLVQIITGMIFEGPQLIGEINLELARLLNRDGFSNLAEAVGIDNR